MEKETLFKQFNNKRYSNTFKSRDILGQSVEKIRKEDDKYNIDRSFNQFNKSQNKKVNDSILNHDIFEIGRQSYQTVTN